MDRNVFLQRRLSNGNVPALVATPLSHDVLTAIADTAKFFAGGARALAALMRTRDRDTGELVPMNANTFAHKVNPRCHSHNVTIEEGVEMMVRSRDYRILYAQAAATGHVAIRLDMDGTGATFERVGVMAKEFSDVVAAVSEAQSKSGKGGTRVTPNEMAQIEREAADLIGALNGLVANMRAQVATVVH
jgi:hypothetical protein